MTLATILDNVPAMGFTNKLSWISMSILGVGYGIPNTCTCISVLRVRVFCLFGGIPLENVSLIWTRHHFYDLGLARLKKNYFCVSRSCSYGVIVRVKFFHTELSFLINIVPNSHLEMACYKSLWIIPLNFLTDCDICYYSYNI